MERKSETIEPGDVVWLKSGGGPPMTVTSVSGDQAVVAWFEEASPFKHHEVFPRIALTQVEPKLIRRRVR